MSWSYTWRRTSVDIVTVTHFKEVRIVEFKLEIYLNVNNAHKAACRRSTSVGVVTCTGA